MNKLNIYNTGSTRIYYKSIFGDYRDRNLDEKTMNIPDIITQDIGLELILNMKHTDYVQENAYCKKKHTPILPI